MKIGLLFSHTSEDDRLTNNANYIDWLNTIGDVVVIDPYWNKPKKLDLLVLPGGSDVNPRRYMDYWPIEAGLPNRAFEYFDEVILPAYINQGTPILGICRGMQTLNVLFGGTLFPHLPEEPVSYQEGDEVHYIKYDNQFYKCSSNHHQAVDKLGNGLSVIMQGYATTKAKDQQVWKTVVDKNKPLSIEGFRHDSFRILGLQFHPEKNHARDTCKALQKIVTNLVTSL